MLTNGGGRPGQVLVLTKPLGIGVLATALKAGEVDAESAAAAATVMVALNRAASEAALRHGVTGATAVTGFGLAGHAAALARESGLTLELDLGRLPLLPGALDRAERFQAGGLKANRREFEPRIEYSGSPDPARAALLFDPQTSGGLLLLVPAASAAALLGELPTAWEIGRAVPARARPLLVRA
jgi:selenide,water dikinase